MSIFYSFYRLYGIWFILSSLLAVWIYTDTNYIPAAIITKFVVLPAICWLKFESIKKHSYYFQNLGFSIKKLFLTAFAIDLILLVLIILLISVLNNA